MKWKDFGVAAVCRDDEDEVGVDITARQSE